MSEENRKFFEDFEKSRPKEKIKDLVKNKFTPRTYTLLKNIEKSDSIPRILEYVEEIATIIDSLKKLLR